MHFSPAAGWMNDPNGMVYYEGEYHLFYQYYPDGTRWGPMHWGHAVSPDMVQWKHLPIALAPDEHGTIFSGSAVVDWRDTTGFFRGGSGLVAIFTQHDTDPGTGKQRQRQSLAYSSDKGRTWTMYAGNPVLSEPELADFRDPKVFWYEPKRQWVMVISAADHIRFYRSDDLKSWELTGQFGNDGQGSHDGVWECPDLFELPVDGGAAGLKKWVLIVSIGERPDLPEGSRTQYFVGSFDGDMFHNDNPAETVLWLDAGRDNYAGVTWSDIPEEDGRRLFIGWMSNWKYANLTPTDKWRGAMTIPRELRLYDSGQGVRLRQFPVRELEELRKSAVHVTSAALRDGERKLLIECGGLLDMEAQFEWDEGTSEIGLILRMSESESEETVIGLDTATLRLFADRTRSGDSGFHPLFACRHDAVLEEPAGERKLKLRMIMDRCSVEVFANDGSAVITDLVFPLARDKIRMEAYVNGGRATVQAEAIELQSIYSTE
nr:glycoside hydrolase family 32 protein [Paenibacillus hamazuiensis]